jgi:hypothetical protein
MAFCLGRRRSPVQIWVPRPFEVRTSGKAGGLIFVPLKAAVPEMALKGQATKPRGVSLGYIGHYVKSPGGRNKPYRPCMVTSFISTFPRACAPDRVDGVLPGNGCRPVPHRTGQVDFPTYGSSAFIQAQRHSEKEYLLWHAIPARFTAPKRIQRMQDAHRRPPDPGESIKETFPRVAAPLAPSVQPFEQHAGKLPSELSTHPSVIRDRIVGEMPGKDFLGTMQQFSSLCTVPLPLQPSLNLM